jgi:hypothetical protein
MNEVFEYYLVCAALALVAAAITPVCDYFDRKFGWGYYNDDNL